MKRKGGFFILVHNKEHSEAIQRRLFELGYSWRESGKVIKNTHGKYLCFKEYKDNVTFGMDVEFASSEYKQISLCDLYKLNVRFTISLNDDYKAIVKDGFVKVGCQNIDFDKIYELHDAIELYKELNK